MTARRLVPEGHVAKRRLNERLRAEYIAGAEEEWRKRTGRPMTAEEPERVLWRFSGDVSSILDEVRIRGIMDYYLSIRQVAAPRDQPA